jgi:hypothetical protein
MSRPLIVIEPYAGLTASASAQSQLSFVTKVADEVCGVGRYK